MPEPPPATPTPSIRRHGKVDAPTLLRLVGSFCLGRSVRNAARTAGLTERSTRAIYLELRGRLLKPQFNKWHRAHQRLARVQSPDVEDAMRDAFFDSLSQCFENAACYRNFTAGNRKTRLCRSCPLPGRLSGADKVQDALALVDAVRELYRHLGITAEHGVDRVTLFRARLIHTATLMSVAEDTRRTAAGKFDPKHRSFLSYRTLFDALLADLIDDPL